MLTEFKLFLSLLSWQPWPRLQMQLRLNAKLNNNLQMVISQELGVWKAAYFKTTNPLKWFPGQWNLGFST